MNIDTNAINAIADKLVSVISAGTDKAMPVATEVIHQYQIVHLVFAFGNLALLIVLIMALIVSIFSLVTGTKRDIKERKNSNQGFYYTMSGANVIYVVIGISGILISLLISLPIMDCFITNLACYFAPLPSILNLI